MKLLIGIPAYNEEKTIGDVIKLIPKNICGLKNIVIVVVDDCSSDKTSSIVTSMGITVLPHLINRGLGGALKTIFSYACLYKFDILATLDADGQHDPIELTKLIKPIIEKEADVVIGIRRFLFGKVPVSRIFINKIANLITYFFFGIYSSDTQSGFRIFNQKAINSIHLQTDGMEVSSEIFREIAKNKLKFTEIPIKTIYTVYSKKKGQKLSNAPNVFIQLLIRLLR